MPEGSHLETVSATILSALQCQGLGRGGSKGMARIPVPLICVLKRQLIAVQVKLSHQTALQMTLH